MMFMGLIIHQTLLLARVIKLEVVKYFKNQRGKIKLIFICHFLLQ